MENPFGTAASKPQEETGNFTELPLNVWFVARTSDRGGAAPQIKDNKAGEPFLFKTGMYAVGGDGKKVTPKMYGGYTFFQAFLRPNLKDQGGPQSQDDYDLLSGRLIGFMNALLSPGIEDKDVRWTSTMGQLVKYANELKDSADPDNRLTPEMFQVGGLQDNAAYMASVFALLLRNSPRLVIVNQKVDKGAKGDRNDLVVGSFKDATEENSKTTNGVLSIFTSREGETFEFYGTPVAGEEVASF